MREIPAEHFRRAMVRGDSPARILETEERPRHDARALTAAAVRPISCWTA